MSNRKEIQLRINELASKRNLQISDIQNLSILWGALQALEKDTPEESEYADIFPALTKYQKEHNIINLQKLCVEIQEFCQSVYTSTKNEEERKVYRAMLDKLTQ